MTEAEIRQLADHAEREGNNALAAILFTYHGAVALGMENELSHYVVRFAQATVDGIEYNEWVDNG